MPWVSGLNRAFPYTEVKPEEQHWRMLHEVPLPVEDDRHALAAALAAGATVLSTSNTKDFPAQLVEALGFEVLTPDQLLGRLVVEYGRRCSPSIGRPSFRSRTPLTSRPSRHCAELAPQRRPG